MASLASGLRRAAAVALLLAPPCYAAPLTELYQRGHSVLPTPRRVTLLAGELELDGSWTYEAEGLATGDIALRFLTRDLREFHGLELRRTEEQGAHDPSRAKRVRLAVRRGSVRTEADAELDRQAYVIRIDADPERIEIVGNAEVGLLYGVQTFIQLLKRGHGGSLRLPLGQIEDWPRFPLRFLHWDSKHHQDRLETLERYIDWAVRFKANRIGFELEDKLAYPSHPVIGAPGAFTLEQLQQLVRYGLERHVQIVPQLQAPAHMAYVLKHPEFAHLRADANNYQADLCDERTYALVFSLYEDAIRATPGVDAFFASTDEVYYAGIGPRCSKPYSPENRSLAWVEFARRARDFLAARGRAMLAWVEYPLLPQHVALLPRDIVNGIMTDDSELLRAQIAAGLPQLAYASMQGSEYLFPNYFALEGESPAAGRLAAALHALAIQPWHGRRIGVYGAAWDDSGLHNETFWLGWSAVAAWGWNPGVPSAEQAAADFIRIYYGPGAFGMADAYHALQVQARFFQRSWDRVASRTREPGYGNSKGKGIGTARYDLTLPAPPLPELPDLALAPVYKGRYERLVDDARRMLGDNQGLVRRLLDNLARAERNRYNLVVLLSLADLIGHHERLILGLKDIEDRLRAARDAAAGGEPQEAVGQLVAAHEKARAIVEERLATHRALKAVWEKSRFPKGAEVGGKKFRHVLDDTKDHWADRRPDLSYLTAPEESIGLEDWMAKLSALVQDYARRHGLNVRPLEAPRLEG